MTTTPFDEDLAAARAAYDEKAAQYNAEMDYLSARTGGEDEATLAAARERWRLVSAEMFVVELKLAALEWLAENHGNAAVLDAIKASVTEHDIAAALNAGAARLRNGASL
jgi:hypothetical protein